MKKCVTAICMMSLLNVGLAFADEAAHHDDKAEKAEHAVCADHDEHCKADEAGIEKSEHAYCADHKGHCDKHGKKDAKAKKPKAAAKAKAAAKTEAAPAAAH